MGSLFSYSICAGLVLAVMYLVYKWLMAAERQHAYNRGLLLGIYAVALLVPGLMLRLHGLLSPAPTGAATVGFELIPLGADPAASEPASALWLRALIWSYLAGMALTGAASVLTAIRLAAVIASGEKIPSGGKYTLILLDRPDIAPFSWRKYIVMSRADYAAAGPLITAHECRHLALRHWIDLAVAQAIAVLMWYNPAAWLMREELKTVHEYQADEAVLRSGVNAREYQMLLIKKAVGARFPSLANSLNHSKLKKRITMMYNSETSPRGRRLRALSLAPALAVALIGANVPFVSNALNALASTELSAPAGVSDTKVSQNSAPAQEMDAVVVVGYAASGNEKSTKGDIVAVSDNKVAPANEMASYPGGDAELMKYLASSISYPLEARKTGKEGRVAVRFTVLADGSVADPQILKSVSPELDAEALRVIGAMPKWKPARENGKAVPSSFVLPVEFRLMKDEPEKPKAKPVVFIDGVRTDNADLASIPSSSIASIDVDKSDPAHPEGIVRVTLKK